MHDGGGSESSSDGGELERLQEAVRGAAIPEKILPPVKSKLVQPHPHTKHTVHFLLLIPCEDSEVCESK